MGFLLKSQSNKISCLIRLNNSAFFSIFAYHTFMKALTVILSFYIVVLTIIPCIDKPHEKTVGRMELSGNSTHSDEQGADHCSPFCVCSCCGNHVVSIEKMTLSNVFSFPGKQIPWFTADFKSDPSRSIWQPPKIS
jgi:hypothetical protein